MEKFISGKTLEEALETACTELSLSREDFTYEIVDVPVKGFLGIGAKPAKIKVVYQLSPEDYIKEYIKGLFGIMKIENYDIKVTFAEDKLIDIQIDGDDASVLTHKQSDAVESLQLLIAITINKLCNERYKITFNVNDYKEKSVQRIEELSVKSAEQVMKTKKRIVLNAMSAYQRRIVHSKLQEYKDITTYSVGEEPNRKVIISYQGPGGQKPYQKFNSKTGQKTNRSADTKQAPRTNTNKPAYQKANNNKPYAPRPNTNKVFNKDTTQQNTEKKSD